MICVCVSIEVTYVCDCSLVIYMCVYRRDMCVLCSDIRVHVCALLRYVCLCIVVMSVCIFAICVFVHCSVICVCVCALF